MKNSHGHARDAHAVHGPVFRADGLLSRWARACATFAMTLAVSAFLGVSLGGCEREELEPLRRDAAAVAVNAWTGSVKAEFCTTDALTIKTLVKVIFIIDKSRSNFDNLGAEGTDIDGSRRYGGLATFIRQRETDPQLFVSLVNFGTEATIVSEFTKDKAKFLELIEAEKTAGGGAPPLPRDDGWTNFTAALARAKTMIDEDIQANAASLEPMSSSYVVFFVSDGAPWISDATLQTPDEVLAAVNDIASLEKKNRESVDGINIHTAYYFLQPAARDTDAARYLQEIAKAGKGDFYQFGSGNTIDFSQFSAPQSLVRNAVREVFVENASARWTDANLQLDTDRDGLVDGLEVKLGSNPGLADSDGNGVSDAVEHASTGKPCKDAKCAKELAEPFKACQGWLDAAAPAGTVRFVDTDKDLLNDCEEQVLLRSRRDRFDSNFDWIPDWLAFKNDVGFVASVNEAKADPDFDAVSNYDEIKYNSPTRIKNDRLSDLKRIRFALKPVSETPRESCYSLTADEIATVGESAVLRVFVLESNAINAEKRFLRVGEKTVTAESPRAVFKASDIR